MEAKAFPEIFRNTVLIPTPTPIIDTNQKIIEKSEFTNSNYSFSLQFLASLGAIAVGLALLIAGLTVGAYPVAAIGVGLILVGSVGTLHSHGFFSKKPSPKLVEDGWKNLRVTV